MKSNTKLAVIFLFLLSTIFVLPFGVCGTQIVDKRVYANRDTYIDSYSGTSNYGGQDYICIGELIVGYDHTYLHFDLSDAPEEFVQVYLCLDFYYISETIDISCFTTANNWNELTITWINAPIEDLLISHFYNLAEEKKYSLDIKSFMDTWNNDEISIIVKEYDYSETGYIQGKSREGTYSDYSKPHLKYQYEVEFDEMLITLVVVGVILGIIALGSTIYFLNRRKKAKISKMHLQAKTHNSPYAISMGSVPKTCSNCGSKIDGSFCSNCGQEQL